jgi:anti-sigma factor RsiW
MTCREFIDLLMAYLSVDLSTREQADCERHLTRCRDCSTYLRSYQDTITLAKAGFADPAASVPGEVAEELVQAILASRGRENTLH